MNWLPTKLTASSVSAAWGMISFQSFALRLAQVDGHQPPPRGVGSVLKKSTGPSLPTKVYSLLEVVDQLDRHGVRLGQVVDRHAVLRSSVPTVMAITR